MSQLPVTSNKVFRIEIKEIWRTDKVGKKWMKLHDDAKIENQYGWVEGPETETGERTIFVGETLSRPSLVALAKIVEPEA